MLTMPTETKRTRDAILERAVALASVEGLEGLTIGRLSSDLGLSKSGLFGHFGSKEELQVATVRAAAEHFIREVVQPASREPEGAPRLRALRDAYIGYLEQRALPGGCFWGAASSEFDGRPGPVRDAVRRAVEAWLGELERQAAAAGVEDPRQLAFELYALVQGANAAFQLLGDGEAFSRARAASDRLLPG